MTMTMNDGNDHAYCCRFADVQAAATRIQGVAHRTPVLTSQSINDMMNGAGAEAEAESTATARCCRLFFKVEALQKTGSFKFRGALNAVRSILEQQQQEQPNEQSLTVVTHSSGNHAQALALAAKLSTSRNGGGGGPVQATIVMPESAPRVKTQAVIDFGGTPVLVANNNEAREEACERIRQETGAIFVHPSEDPRVIAGQGTVCLELVQQTQEQHALDVVIIPVGGGGLAAGNTIALRALLGPDVKIVLAEPAEMDDACRSFRARQLLAHLPDNPLDSVADGLKTTLGPNTWPIVRDGVDDIYTVSETQILKATKIVWERLKITIEPSAGVGVAVALFHPEFRQKYCSVDQGKEPIADRNERCDNTTCLNIGIVLCGGNVDVVKIAALMHEMEV